MLLLLLGAALLVWAYPLPRTATVPMDTPSAFLPTDGLYRWERFKDQAGGFRWTNGGGTVTLPNPGGQVRLRLRLLGSNPKGTPTQMRTGALSTTLTITPNLRAYHLLLPPSSGERFSVTLTSPTIRANKRGVGVALSDAVLAGGALPLRLLPALLLATLGSYALLRRAGWPCARAAGGALALLLASAAWHANGGWRYGLLGGALGGLGAACLAAVVLARQPQRRGDGETGRRGDEENTPSFVRPFSWSPLLLIWGVALAVRLPLLFMPDPVGDLELSARRMGLLLTHGLRGAFDGGGDYVPLRLYILYGLAQISALLGGTFSAPLHPATQVLIKLPGLLADLGTIGLIWAAGDRGQGTGDRGQGTGDRGQEDHAAKTAPKTQNSKLKTQNSKLIPLLYALAPPVWINVAWWGQVDALLMLPLVAAVLLLERGGGRWSWLCWAAALLIKAQAIVLAPILFVATVRRYGCRGLLRNAAWAAALFVAACVPFFLVGEGLNLAQAYLGSVERFPRTSFGAYNLWYLLLGGADVRDTTLALGAWSYRQLGLALIGAATLLICAGLVRRDDLVTCVWATATLLLAFFVLPTQIHERYLFLPLAFLALALAKDRRLIVLFLTLVATATLNIVGVLSGFAPAAKPLIAASPLPLIAAATNVAVLVALLAWPLTRRLGADERHVTR